LFSSSKIYLIPLQTIFIAKSIHSENEARHVDLINPSLDSSRGSDRSERVAASLLILGSAQRAVVSIQQVSRDRLSCGTGPVLHLVLSVFIPRRLSLRVRVSRSTTKRERERERERVW